MQPCLHLQLHTCGQDVHRACHCCELIHRLPTLSAGQRAVCTRCGATMHLPGSRQQSASRTAAPALGAFVLFWPAVLCPILQSEKLGHRHESSVLSGTFELLQHGNLVVGLVVLLLSVVFPLAKIALLLELSLLELLHRRHKATTLRLMEHVGKWSMMDVMLLALLEAAPRSWQCLIWYLRTRAGALPLQILGTRAAERCVACGRVLVRWWCVLSASSNGP